MSQVIIEFEDSEDGKVDVKFNFYPELNLDGVVTSAQALALKAIAHLKETSQGDEDE